MQNDAHLHRLVIVFRPELPLRNALCHLWNVVFEVELTHFVDQCFRVNLLAPLELVDELLDSVNVAH